MSNVWQLAVYLMVVKSNGNFLGVHKEQNLLMHILAFSFETCSSDKAPQLLKKTLHLRVDFTCIGVIMAIFDLEFKFDPQLLVGLILIELRLPSTKHKYVRNPTCVFTYA